jgi:hypothetical protein
MSSGIVAHFHSGPFPLCEPLGVLRLGLVALGGYSSPLSATVGLIFVGNANEENPAAFQGAGGVRFRSTGGLAVGSSLSGAARQAYRSQSAYVAGISAHVLDADAILKVTGTANEAASIPAFSGALFRIINITGLGGVALGIEISGVLLRPGVAFDEDTWLLLRRKEDN